MIDKILNSIDGLVPDPWIIDGKIQARPTTQLSLVFGVVFGSIISFIFM